MRDSSHTVGQELHGVALFVGAIWAVFLVSLVFPSLDDWGVVPRTASGLAGIPAMPFLHASFRHIISNTIPLVILLLLLAGSRARSWEVVLGIILLGGAFLWIVGRHAMHIGASGLVFGLIAFLLVSGFREGRLVPLLIAILVGFLYGGTLLWGVLPSIGTDVSWDGHLCGAAAGALIGYAVTMKEDTARGKPGVPGTRDEGGAEFRI